MDHLFLTVHILLLLICVSAKFSRQVLFGRIEKLEQLPALKPILEGLGVVVVMGVGGVVRGPDIFNVMPAALPARMHCCCFLVAAAAEQ